MSNRLELTGALALNGSTPEPTCATCRHWHQHPVDPHNVTAPRQGECRERLHSFPLFNQHMQVASVTIYRPITPPEFSCGQHQPREEG